MKYKVAVIIVSDRAARGERPDACLPEFEKALDRSRFDLARTSIVPDEKTGLTKAIVDAVESGCHLVFTAGGTGCGPRDITPEAVRPLLDKLTPGIDEAIRSFSSERNRNAIFSRSVSGIARQSLIISLPGSPKAVSEILSFLVPLIEHPLALICGETTDCNKAASRND